MQGKIVNTDKLHKHIWTYGLFYYNKINGERICKVKNIEFAVILEIGRTMREEGINFEVIYKNLSDITSYNKRFMKGSGRVKKANE